MESLDNWCPFPEFSTKPNKSLFKQSQLKTFELQFKVKHSVHCILMHNFAVSQSKLDEEIYPLTADFMSL